MNNGQHSRNEHKQTKNEPDKSLTDDKALIAKAIEYRATQQARKIAFLRIGKLVVDSFFIIFATIPFFLLIFMLLYLIKSALGIDIFPDKHLWDIILFE